MAGPLTAVVVGAGQRGHDVHGAWALGNPGSLRFVGVAEPDPVRRQRFRTAHRLEASDCHATWQTLLGGSRSADVCIVATPDRDHVEPAVAAIRAGYAVLLEKPVAPDLDGLERLLAAVRDAPVLVAVAHVLRYTAFFRRLHDIVSSGELGDIVTVEHRENVAYWHMAHSFVRGNWAVTGRSAPMILAKCCHDFDVLGWNLGAVRRLQSFGSLIHFGPRSAPPDATDRCTDGCPVACPFDARRLYLGAYTGWPVSTISEDPGREARLEALRTGPYGRCVYHCDNDVVDHQTVNMEMESGASAVLVMHGHSQQETRTMRYDGTRATLRGRFGGEDDVLEIRHHLGDRVERVPVDTAPGGHGGGDDGLLRAFLAAVQGVGTVTTLEEAAASHRLALAAEQSRATATVVEVGGS